MPLADCRFDRVSDEIRVKTGGALWLGDNGLIGSADAVADCSLTSLKHASRRAHHYLGVGADVRITLYNAPEAELRLDDEAFPSEFDLTFTGERILLECFMLTEPGARFDRHELAVQLSAALTHHGLRVHALASYDHRVHTVWYLTLEIPARGRSISDARAAFFAVQDLWYATLGGAGISVASAAAFIRAQRPELLIGTAESEWLEVKRAGYALQRTDQQLELAKDVAALANTANGGLLVIGLITVSRGGQDVIVRYEAVDPTTIEPAKYLSVLRSTVYPMPERMTIERIETEPGGALLLIDIPAQPPEVRPVLVKGAIAEGRVLGSHVSLVTRRGDLTVPTDPVVLHSLIAAGRAALSGAFSPAIGASAEPPREPGADISR